MVFHMLQAFIVTLREGVEAALMVGITLAYLSKIGRPELRKSVFAALIAAFVGSIGIAILLSRTQWNQDIFEGWIMLAAAFFVVTMIIFMMKTGRALKGQIEGKVSTLAGKNAAFGLFLFVFLMVLREGVETVLILGAVSLNSTELLSFLGTLAGVIVAILFEVKRRQPVALPDSPAERRKAMWSARRERLWMVSVYASSFLFILMVTAEFIYTKSVSALSPATEVTFTNGQLSIPLTQVSDGDLHRFEAEAKGTAVRFWLYKRPDGKVATVFDACQICGPVGFYKGPNGVVCKNCAAPINGQSVGTAGGCNPIPLPAEQTSDAVIIRETDIAAGA